MPACLNRFLILALLIVGSTPAFAHTGVGETGAFVAGLTHPFGGLDHALAMIAVGLWAGLAGGRALLIWPIAFVGGMLAGGALAMAGLSLPFVEPGIAGSVIVLGFLVALAVRAPLAIGAAVVALFAVVHGYAHGSEAPATGSGLAYAAGFALATAALHAIGIALVLACQRVAPLVFVRAAGVATALAGLGLAAGALGN